MSRYGTLRLGNHFRVFFGLLGEDDGEVMSQYANENHNHHDRN